MTVTIEDARKELARRQSELAFRAQDELDRRAARSNLLKYVSRCEPGFDATAKHTKLVVEHLEALDHGDIERLMLFMPPQHGKLIADSTPVPTPTGWTTHGELRVGDYVFGGDGLPTPVIALSEPGVANQEVVFGNGEAIKVHGAHEWFVYDRSGGRDYGWRVMETRQIAGRRLRSGKRFTIQAPRPPVLHAADADLPLEPYVLGAWLGDGTTGKPWITHHVDEGCVIGAVAAAGYVLRKQYRINDDRGRQSAFLGLADDLRATGVFERKRIPMAYLRASELQRLELLAGLIDTDGSVYQKRGRIRLICADDDLTGDIVELVRTFGWYVNDYVAAPCRSSSGIQGKKPVHYIGFEADRVIPTRVPHKRVEGKPFRRFGIEAVRAASPERGRCIQVAAADGLYLVGKTGVVTHNSFIASETFPGSWIGRRELRGERTNVLLTSYGASKAYDFSRSVRENLDDPDSPFPSRVSPTSHAIAEWRTVMGSLVVAAGVGGPITGRGFHLVGIDDPIKDYVEASSPGQREKKWQWYLRVARTRFRRNARVFLAQTRWHEKDLAGMILASPQAKRWTVLSLEAICEHPETDPLHRKKGEALWPAGPEIPLPGDGETTTAVFESMYQQRPVPEGGLIFKRAWFQYADRTRVNGEDTLVLHRELGDVKRDRLVKMRDCWRAQFVDLAASLATKADYFVIETWAITPAPFDMVLMDVVRVRATADQQLEELKAAHRKWHPFKQGIEDVAYQKAFVQLAQKAGLPAVGVKVTANKEARAMVAAARYEARMVFHLNGQPWLDTYEAEMLSFPNGEHDDQVDPCSMCAQVVSELGAPPAQGIRIG